MAMRAQWTPTVLGVPVVHPIADRRGAVEEVAKEEHLARLGHDLQSRAGEQSVAT